MSLVFGSLSFDEITLGMHVSYSKRITDTDIVDFAKMSGDKNPLHLDSAYAKKSRFKKRIAHGLISASYFSALFGTKIPGPGCLYVSQLLRFKRPVYIDDTVIATVIVRKIDKQKRRIFFDTTCQVNGKLVIDGEAEIYVPKERFDV